MYVEQRPLVLAMLRDNSSLPLSDSRSLQARVNLVPIDTSNSSDIIYSFGNDVQSLPQSQSTTRAALQFRPSLEAGTNSLRLRVRDYFGNETIRNLIVRVSRDVGIDDVKVYPNPYTSVARIQFDVKSPILTQNFTLNLYDIRGEQVLNIKRAVRIGSNNIEINDRDMNGNQLMQGSYYYRLFVGVKGNLDMRTGVILLVR